MLTITDLGFTLAGRRLFDGATMRAPDRARIGLVGRNGTGKTTLFRLIEGELTADAGTIEIRRGARIGGVKQEVPAGPDPLIEIVLAADRERASLLAEAEVATDPHRIAEIQLRLTDIDAHSAEARAAAILSGLGFDAAAQARAAAEFSGGWRMRVALASVLFAAPDLLLLDEPTNYLDLEGAVWLESFLARYPATAMVISHDRGLLNRSVDRILHLSGQKLTLYAGGYDDFDKKRRADAAQTEAAIAKQTRERAHIQSFVDRFRYKASKAKQAQSRLKMLERMQPISSAAEGTVAPFRFHCGEELSPPIIAFEKVSVGYDGKPVLRDISLRIDPDDRIALLGANGQGKSTLAKLISRRLSPIEGVETRAAKLRIGYFAQHQTDELHEDETPVQHIRRLLPDQPEAKLRGRLGAVGIGAEIATNKVRSLSGGQKARLLLALMTVHQPQLLILDEPTNHLDIESREALAQALAEYEGAVILIAHDAELVGAVADRLWLVSEGGVKPFDGDMDDYRALLLADRGGVRREREKAEKPKPAKRDRAAERATLATLRAEARAAEARVAKIETMKAKIDEALADPDLYISQPKHRFAQLQKKRAEIVEGLERAEQIWLKAQERLDDAE
ncbi:ABC-F family ATP-binding cassette domain-containing protein [Pikeienuella piscinae]|uniref:ABC-F family ATP-binding cassette domain-containing protein n=1 Tax=Pikeienuella piscinae TaxID=2748098 RepID=A0A7L5BTB5_9RHOB|nr:ABC-F family ATP-binding cassette domain-containing protein [Pikeienuella piscinae]QIE54582.1 ABC-F family ATP-binding cassette domain-containing protein [Pikeienuella piscinae]